MNLHEVESALLDRFGHLIAPEPNSGCWLWAGAVNRPKPTQYAVATFRGRYRTLNSIVKEMLGIECQDMRHTCGISICVNPRHLTGGTRSQNIKDIPPTILSAKCRKAGLARVAAMTPQQRSEQSRKANASLTQEQRMEKSRKLKLSWEKRRV